MNKQMKNIIICPPSCSSPSSLSLLQVLSMTNDSYRGDLNAGKFKLLCFGGVSKMKTLERDVCALKCLIY